MSLLVSGVLGDEVEIFAADDEGTVHLRADDGAGQDAAADGDHACERAFLVCKASQISTSEPQTTAVQTAHMQSFCISHSRLIVMAYQYIAPQSRS